MSIIQDALKKTENYIDKKRPDIRKKFEEGISFKETVPVEKTPALSKKIIYVSISAFFILIILVALSVKQFLLVTSVTNKLKTKVTGEETAKPAVTALPAVMPRAEIKKMLSENAKVTEELAAYTKPQPAPSVSGPKMPNLTLNGIMYREEDPQAIINNYILKEGETINGARIIKIKPDVIILDYEGAEVILKLRR